MLECLECYLLILLRDDVSLDKVIEALVHDLEEVSNVMDDIILQGHGSEEGTFGHFDRSNDALTRLTVVDY